MTDGPLGFSRNSSGALCGGLIQTLLRSEDTVTVIGPLLQGQEIIVDVRKRRLQSDLHRLLELSRHSGVINAQPLNDLCDRYTVSFHCRGLAWMAGHSAPSITMEHRVSVYLHIDYPRLPPLLQWLTPIFHPNILPPELNGGVCFGRWSPSETLADLVVRIGEMVSYRNYSTTDALDLRAAAWAEQNRSHLPLEASPLSISPPAFLGIVIRPGGAS